MNYLSNFFTKAIIFSLTLFAFSCSDSEENEGTVCTPCLVEIDGTFTEVNLDKDPDYSNNGYNGLINDLYKDLKYPFEARQNSVEGDVFASFIIRKDGTVDTIEILEDPGTGLGDAVVVTLTKIMEGISFSPGEIDGEPVDVKTGIEVKFRLEG